jgi:hypoxanthine phosphoribosyltransferase
VRAAPVTEPELLLGAGEIADEVARIARRLDEQHPDGVTVVGMLKGGVVLAADLVRQLSVPTRIELVAIAPYDGAATRTRVVKDLDRPVTGEHVVLVTGIVDTGLTADFLLRHLRGFSPASVELATLADKRARRILPIAVHHAVVEAPDRFLLGYGLDYAGLYRNLPDLWCGDSEALASEPRCYAASFYDVSP